MAKQKKNIMFCSISRRVVHCTPCMSVTKTDSLEYVVLFYLCIHMASTILKTIRAKKKLEHKKRKVAIVICVSNSVMLHIFGCHSILPHAFDQVKSISYFTKTSNTFFIRSICCTTHAHIYHVEMVYL